MTEKKEYKELLENMLLLKKKMFLVYKVYILSSWNPKSMFYTTMLKHKKMYTELEEMIKDVKKTIKSL